MRLHHVFAALLIPVGLAGCVAPGPGYGGGGYYGRPAYGGYGGYRAPAYGSYGGYGGYRAPAYGGYGGGYRDQGYARQAPPRNDGGGWGGGQRQAPQASRGSGSPEIDRAIGIARQRQQQQNPATQ